MEPSELRKLRISQIEKEILNVEKHLKRLNTISKKFTWYRLTLFLSGIAAFLLLFFFTSNIAAIISAVMTIVFFGLLVMVHNKVDFSIKKFTIWSNHKKENIARIKVDWTGIPYKTDVSPNDSHNFESDLNISGKYSLLHLINLSVTEEGTNILHKWLTTPIPDKGDIEEKQLLVRELASFKMFREKLHLNSELTYRKKNSTHLSGLLKSNTDPAIIRTIVFALSAVITINIILFMLYIFAGIPSYFAIGLLVQLAIYWFNSRKISSSLEQADSIKQELGKFSRILEFLESYPYKKNSKLHKLCEVFLEKTNSPSVKFKQISNATTALSLSSNQISSLIFNILFPWDFYHVYKFELLKKSISDKLPLWLETWFKLEALTSLANLSYIYPDFVFPTLNDASSNEKNIFTITNAGHPLIPFDQCIRNSFSFTKTGECIIITGSNMSGKSTFLKTMGVNLALCYSGAPVCASGMETSLFRLFTCIKVSDSVTDGISYFYAEVKRLKKLLNELNRQSDFPLFYLIDEIFRGTNNLERLTGSRSFIKALAGSNSAGMISTHDLELVKLEEEIDNIFNYHFREEVITDRMNFDYKLHNGPCPTTNALKIMELEGLPVE
jgi:DNA mismatch repair ATPase MutS